MYFSILLKPVYFLLELKSSSLIRLSDVGKNQVFQVPVTLIGHPRVIEEKYHIRVIN